MELLPVDVANQILSWLHPNRLAHLRLVSQSFKKIIESPTCIVASFSRCIASPDLPDHESTTLGEPRETDILLFAWPHFLQREYVLRHLFRFSSIDFGGDSLNVRRPLPDAFVDLPNLRYLDLESCGLNGHFPRAMEGLQLVSLNLGLNSMHGAAPVLSDTLVSLTLSCNNFSGSLEPFYKLRNLETLVLRVNSYSGCLDHRVVNWKQLVFLDLSHNSLSGTIPPEIGSLTSLKVLFLASNLFSGSLPTSIGNLIHLIALDGSDNNLTGPLMPELGQLASLEQLNLSCNRFNGPLPPGLANLRLLEQLNLSGNELVGSVPAEYAALSNLRELFLDGNAGNWGGGLPDGLSPQLDEWHY